MKNMDLDTAYEIVGGYIDADDKTFEAALEIVRQKDEELARLCKEAHDKGTLTKKTKGADEKIGVSSAVLASNTEYLYNELGNNNLETWLLSDSEVDEALEHTPIVDSENGTVFEVSGKKRDDHINMLVEKAKLDVLCEQAKSQELADASDEEKQEILKNELKTTFLSTLMHLRTAAQIQDNIPNASQAVVDNDEEFFKNQQITLMNMEYQDKASDFSQEIAVSSDLVISACAETEHNARKFAKKISDLSLSAKGKTKSLLEKASGLVHKASESFKAKAKEVWGQRYEFAYNLKDKAPKVITDITATTGLIGATIVNAPWLGTAVIAYGAYKVTSSWVWPIITKARKEARLDRKNKNAPKVKFMDRLRKASNTIFNNKEERKAYINEAGWESAAGLVGLGAAGAIASNVAGTASAIAARGAQRLASLAVTSLNGAINTVKTLKSKKKDWWSKAFAVTGFVATTALLATCIDGCEGGGNTPPSTNLNNVTPPADDLTSIASEKEDIANKAASLNATQNDVDSLTTNDNVVTTVSEEATKEVAETQTVSAPTEWSKESGITERQWNRLQSFWGGAEKYQEYYSKITDDMLQPGGAFEGMTRDEVLFKYERMSSWNLLQHRDDIAKFDKFFECGEYQLTANDGKVLDLIMDDGSVLGVKGEANICITGREVDCGNNDILHTQKVVNTTPTPVIEETSNIVSEETPTPAAEPQNEFDNVKGEKIDVTNEQTYNVEIVQSNNLSEGSVVNQVTGDEVAASVENKAVVTDVVSEKSETVVTVLSGAETDLDGSSAADSTAKSATVSTTEVTESTVDTQQSATSSTNENTTTSSNLTTITDWENADVVANSDDVAPGTPAAGNVAERGGYNNTGITEKQYNATQTFFKDRYGENAYEYFSSMITDELRAKGAVFEGLSVEQSMFSVKQMIAWSNDQHGEFSKEITETVNYLKGCSAEISPTSAPDIKEVIDRVNENGTIDGVTGTKNVVVRYFQVGDCGEAGTYGVEAAAEGVTKPSTDGFDRLFLRPKVSVVSETPIVEFDEVQGQSFDLVEEEDYDISIVKSNNLDNGTIVSNGVNADEIKTNIENRDIVVERKISSATIRNSEGR
jgi:hypothetical protein